MKPPPAQWRNPIILFLILVFALSSIFYTLIISHGRLGGGFGMYVTGLMWCPGIAAILTAIISKRQLSSLGWRWPKTKYTLQSYLVPLLYDSIA